MWKQRFYDVLNDIKIKMHAVTGSNNGDSVGHAQKQMVRAVII
jgi:hypothetical protein